MAFLFIVSDLCLMDSGLALVTEPNRCLSRALSECQIKTQLKPEVLHWQGNQLWMAAESMLEWTGGELRLVAGEMWIQSKDPIAVVTNYIRLETSGDVWIKNLSDRTLVRHLDSQSLKIFSRLKNKQKFNLSPGFENWYAGVNSNNEIEQGVARPLVSADVLAEWIKNFHVPIKVAKGKWAKWNQTWHGNIELGSRVYEEAVKREIASIETKKKRLQQDLEQRAQERLRMQEMFRQKNGFDRNRDRIIVPF